MKVIPAASLIVFDEPTPCESIMRAAAQYYAEPLKNLKLKAPLPVLYEQSGVEEPIGQWVSGVPRPGDVAGCLNTKVRKVLTYPF